MRGIIPALLVFAVLCAFLLFDPGTRVQTAVAPLPVQKPAQAPPPQPPQAERDDGLTNLGFVRVRWGETEQALRERLGAKLVAETPDPTAKPTDVPTRRPFKLPGVELAGIPGEILFAFADDADQLWAVTFKATDGHDDASNYYRMVLWLLDEYRNPLVLSPPIEDFLRIGEWHVEGFANVSLFGVDKEDVQMLTVSFKAPLIEAPPTNFGVAKAACARRWPDDYTMQEHCYNTETDAAVVISKAVEKLWQDGPTDAPDEMQRMAWMCFDRWARDLETVSYEMMLHCLRAQLESYESLYGKGRAEQRR